MTEWKSTCGRFEIYRRERSNRFLFDMSAGDKWTLRDHDSDGWTRHFPTVERAKKYAEWRLQK